MPKASQLAAELRKFADSLDKNPDAEIQRVYAACTHYSSSKEEFLALVKLLPRPLKKSTSDYGLSSGPELNVEYNSEALCIHISVPQAATCTLITPAQPAVYDCNPILSAEDEAEIEATYAD